MIGKMLGNRYEILEQIGIGGMSVVYKARCHLLDRYVAIKVLKEDLTNDEEFIKKFRKESQAAASLSHPNIVNIYDVGYDKIDGKDIHYIVMEYINGKTLKEVITEKGRLSESEALDYSIQIAEALKHAHKNHIIHRDIKPHNIMITEDNIVKVTDFGIARAVTSSTITTTSNVLGSVHYFSPEQARGGYTDEKSDIYSLGIVMYEMLTGKVPFNGETPIGVALKHVQDEIVPPIEQNPNISSAFNKIILKCVQKRQSDRYQNVDELLTDLKNIYVNKNKSNGAIITDETLEMTKLIPPVDEKSLNNENKNKQNNINRSSKGETPTKKKTTVMAIISAFVLASLLFIGYLQLRNNFSNNDYIVTPNLVGISEEEARKKAEDMGFELDVIDRVQSTDFDKGIIISQNVEEGVKIKPGYPIGVVISLGSENVEVPNLINKSITEAEKLLKEAGLKLGNNIEYEYHDSIPIDHVISQSIEPYTEIAPNTRVDLVISKGPKNEEVIMIQLVGENVNKAISEIKNLGLAVGDIKYESSDKYAANIVMEQSQEPGSTLKPGTAIDLKVSSGPDTTTPTNPTEPGGEETPGTEEVLINLTVTPFADKDETEITIIRKQDGDTSTVYTKKHKSTDGTFDIPVTGKKGAVFEVYYDGIFQYSKSIEG
ncbi:MAG TPA: Stk1 family PASTA domain-containing Ser/Thr kinase [Soehngenia sp.]|nr:Stk1 family PASTA domain-containing Ser/Thr kinase [Soehngenia sp.]HPP31536.1 Stk1 family PASTA domain-containing Ser/Thr kinase [Soehngenia sp.]